MKSWFDPRAVLLALLLAVAASLPVLFSNAERRDFYFFDVTLTSTDLGTTQLFWDMGKGINEYDSSVQPLRVETQPTSYRFMMPAGKITGLRFDLVDRHSVMTLTKARIVNRLGRTVHEFAIDDFKAGQQIARFEPQGDKLLVETQSGGNDPVLDLKLAAPVDLPKNAVAWLIVSAPVLIPVLVIGLILGFPPLVMRLQRYFAALAVQMQRGPRRAIALTAVVMVAVQMHPVLFFGRSFVSPTNGSCMLYGTQPSVPGATQTTWTDGMASDVGAMLFNHIYYSMVERDAVLNHHELPLWNRYCLGGEPLLGQGQSMFGDPFNWLTILADGASWAWDVRFAIAHWLLAAGLGFIVLRTTGHLGAAVLVTVSGAFLAYFTFRVNHPATFSLCYSPWILWAWLGLIDAREPRKIAGWFAVLIAVNGTVMTSGTVKEAYMLMVCLNFAGALWVLLLPEAAGRRWQLFRIAGAAGVVFVLLTAPLVMSFLAALRHSVTGYDVPQATPLPLAQFIGFFDDIFYRQNQVGEGVFAPALNALFLVGVLWWLVRPGAWRHDRVGLGLFLAALVPLSLAFGLVPPRVIMKIPFLANIQHVGNTFSCCLMILTAVLAGSGFRNAIERLRERGWFMDYARVVLAIIVLAGFYFHATRAGQKSLFFQGYISALAVAVVTLPLAACWAKRHSRPGLLYVALGLGLPLLFWRHAQYTSIPFNHYAWTPGERVNVHARSPAVAFVDGLRHEPVRVIGLQNNLFPSYHVALHWESLYGVDALRNWYYHTTAAAFGLERVWMWDRSVPEEKVPAQLRAHDLLNVAYYVANHGEPRAIPGLEPLAQRDLDIYRSPTAWPRAFFTDRLDRYATVEEFARMVLTNDGRPFAAVQRGETRAPKISDDLSKRIVLPAFDWKLTANTTTFTVDAKGPGVAVLTETFYPEDFRVTLDGRPASYFRVNHAFKGVAIEKAGRHTVVFAYWPQHFTIALWLAAAGAGLFATTFVMLVRRPRTP